MEHEVKLSYMELIEIEVMLEKTIKKDLDFLQEWENSTHPMKGEIIEMYKRDLNRYKALVEKLEKARS